MDDPRRPSTQRPTSRRGSASIFAPPAQRRTEQEQVWTPSGSLPSSLNEGTLADPPLGEKTVFAARKPMLLLRFDGVLLLRDPARIHVASLFQLPPRRTRFELFSTCPFGVPTQERGNKMKFLCRSVGTR